MSLLVKISARTDDSSIFFKELTGAFAVDNPTGWGGDNEEMADVISATIELSNAGNTYSLDATTVGFPSANVATEIELTPELFGIDGFISGVYDLKYILKLPGNITITAGVKILLVHKIECCIDNGVMDLDLCCSGTDRNDLLDNFLLLKIAERAFCLLQFEKAQKIIAHLNYICCGRC